MSGRICSLTFLPRVYDRAGATQFALVIAQDMPAKADDTGPHLSLAKGSRLTSQSEDAADWQAQEVKRQCEDASDERKPRCSEGQTDGVPAGRQ